ncbi:hypothetical protein, partial [Streptomyces sp. NTH33]|uniref:hypothetical protein n=1 Tax=Streptomyces sp. NTH33 TaxID=1735453 RepID=UPI001C652FC3
GLGSPLRRLGRGDQEGSHQKSRAKSETYWTHRDTSAYQETPDGLAPHPPRPPRCSERVTGWLNGRVTG